MSNNSMNLQDYVKYRQEDLYTESISRPSYDMTENCRNGDSYSHDLLSGLHGDNVIFSNFVSKKNIQIIQNAIRARIYDETKLTIAEQDLTQILLIMRWMYFTYCKHLPCKIAEQIKELNERTIVYIVPLVVTEVKQYHGYISDAYNTLKLQENPIQTTSHNQQQYSLFQEY